MPGPCAAPLSEFAGHDARRVVVHPGVAQRTLAGSVAAARSAGRTADAARDVVIVDLGAPQGVGWEPHAGRRSRSKRLDDRHHHLGAATAISHRLPGPISLPWPPPPSTPPRCLTR